MITRRHFLTGLTASAAVVLLPTQRNTDGVSLRSMAHPGSLPQRMIETKEIGGRNILTGGIKQMQYYNHRLSDASLEELRISLNRASTATYLNEAGILETVGNG